MQYFFLLQSTSAISTELLKLTKNKAINIFFIPTPLHYTFITFPTMWKTHC
nr:MAG TPA: hypothetical protein [Bacteriophage sp.]